uniref:Uncharacterized protein n=1 Tax=uncultured bacterium Ak20-3 TaxID=798570 RepID=D9MX81_9BACT|nr:hypothetical protein AKSOIL_0350 [uncultured bacterium Ak20-3]
MDTFFEPNNLLGQFSSSISQDEWLAGIDLYRENRISKVDRFEHLICGTIHTIEGKCEVRIKLHPSGRMVQWVECTCARNRKKGIYCSHIAALFFHIHQERDDFADTSGSSLPQISRADDSNTQSMVHGLFQQGRGNITKIDFRGSQLVVYFEVKAGQISQIELDVDKQPAFLESLASIERKLLPTASQDMKVLDDSSSQGIYFYLDDEQKLVGRKVFAIKRGPSKGISTEIENFHEKLSMHAGELREDGWFQLFPAEALGSWVGQKYFAIPKVGYFPINDSFSAWSELASTFKVGDQNAIELISNQFQTYSKNGKIFLHKSLANLQIVDDLVLSEIKVLQENDGWFYLDPHYTTNGKSVGMLDLLNRYAKSKTPFLKSDKMWIRVPDLMLNGKWSVDSSKKCLKVSNLELIKLKQSLGNPERITGKELLLRKLKESTEFNTPSNLPCIAHTQLKLREYQKVGYEWLWWLYDKGLHGLLADDMGLGKTHQAMAVMSAIQSQQKTSGPMFLCICPTTVLDHWMDKIESFAPNLKAIKYYGPKREQLVRNFPQSNTIVTTYGVLLRDLALLERYEWQVVILDEAHFVKNNKTATYRAACGLKGRLRLCLSGTPMENRLSELKNIFDFIVPDYLGTDREFNKNFVNPIEGQKNADKELELRRLINPLKMRRTKEQVLNDLPEKVEDTRHCWLSNEQVALYKEVIASQAGPLLDSLKKDQTPIPYLHVFTVLQLLKQICNHPALIRKTTNWRDGESGKFELFRSLLSEALESNHKIVIYSQYLQMIEIIQNYLKELKVGHVVLTGKSQKRGDIVKKFQTDPEVKVFVGSLLAGGLGIDLTAASVVIHYDRWWNASKENQATDRVHRIGQKNFTQVIKLVSRGTLEEKIDRMIAEKASLFNRFLERDEEAFKNLSREDLINLLQ